MSDSKMKVHFKFLWIFITMFRAAAAATTASACAVQFSPEETGFQVHFYTGNYVSAAKEYLIKGYHSETSTNNASGVIDPNFEILSATSGTNSGELYGVTTKVTYFTMELVGYFKAPETGTYEVSLTNADDSAMVFFGNGFSCCDESSQEDENYTAYVDPLPADTSASGTVYLQEGGYYPMRITYFEVTLPAALSVSVTTPSGTVIENDWSDYIFQFPSSENCIITTASTTVPWTGSGTSTRTVYSGSSEIIEIETPLSTTTVPWTGSVTTTTTIPNPNGSGSLVEIETPLSTTTIPWTGSVTTTTTIPNPNGSGSLVEIETPWSIVTTVSTWTKSYIAVSTFTSNSTPYIETFVPDVSLSSSVATITSISTWTGSSTSVTTFTTGGTAIVETFVPSSSSSSSVPTKTTVSTWTGSSTSVTTFTTGGTAIVETLVPPSTIQTTIPWTGITTSVTTFTSNGTPVVEYLTSASSTAVETTIPWTGTTTSVTTFTSNGIPYIEHLTPYSTVTTPWTGFSTATTLVFNPNGAGSIFEVLTPTKALPNVTVTVYEPCDNGAATIFTTTYGATVSVVVQNPTITAASTVGCDTITIYKPCHTCETATYTTSTGGTVAVIFENPTITAASTNAADTNPSRGETSLSGANTSPASTTVAAVYEGGADSLVYWSSSMVCPILMFLFLT